MTWNLPKRLISAIISFAISDSANFLKLNYTLQSGGKQTRMWTSREHNWTPKWISFLCFNRQFPAQFISNRNCQEIAELLFIMRVLIVNAAIQFTAYSHRQPFLSLRSIILIRQAIKRPFLIRAREIDNPLNRSFLKNRSGPDSFLILSFELFR